MAALEIIEKIQFKVDFHPSGCWTLKKRSQDEVLFSDCDVPLMMNTDQGTFYRAVAALLHKHHVAGHHVDYQEITLDVGVSSFQTHVR